MGPSTAVRGFLFVTSLALTTAPAAFAMSAGNETYAVPIAGTAPKQTAVQRSITTVRRPSVRAPAGRGVVRRFKLVATAGKIKLRGGATVTGYRFDGRSPGPMIRVREGDTVIVKLVNHLPVPTAMHWHGIRLAGSQDGVPGVTQNNVAPGKAYTYRFTVPNAGTYWYHAHQDASRQVPRGLYGPLVVLPRGLPGRAVGHDYFYSLHTYNRGGGGPAGGPIAVNGNLGTLTRRIAPGTPVRLRILNSDNGPRAIGLVGAPFKVVALDGNDLSGPTDLTDTQVPLAAAGRVDLTFTMPANGVALTVASLPDSFGAVDVPPRARVVLRPAPSTPAPAVAILNMLDLFSYGTPQADPLSAAPDVTYPMVIAPATGRTAYSINGARYPNVPSILVKKGQLVRIAIVNKDTTIHPIHLHGHTFAVLADAGRAPTGSPLHFDTYQVLPGHKVLIAFRADNPGLWMLHCHNLAHAALGLDMMVDYVGIKTPFVMGGASGNNAE